jgi:hypothetical protein
MILNKEIAKHFREIHFGGNWTCVNLKDTLSDVTWEQANIKIHDLNTIAALAFHINYYVSGVLDVLNGKQLLIKDKFSFDYSAIQSKDDWKNFLEKCWEEATFFADKIEELQDNAFFEIFSEEKYGNYFRNMIGIIEHSHYHLGQIVIVKKLLLAQAKE